jgi:hypothetical protein
MVSAQRNARLGGRICHKRIIAILSESAKDFQLPHDSVLPQFENMKSQSSRDWQAAC